jgi:hypothetical protein
MELWIGFKDDRLLRPESRPKCALANLICTWWSAHDCVLALPVGTSVAGISVLHLSSNLYCDLVFGEQFWSCMKINVQH